MGQADSMRVILQRIGAQIETIDHRVHIEARTKTGIFIGVVSQLWFGGARRDLSQLR
jgi:hypothetical protein